MVKSASILGVKFDNLTLENAVMTSMELIQKGQKGYVVTPNAEIVYLCYHNQELLNIANQAALTLPDGIGVIYAAKILGQKLSGRVAGIDYASALLKQLAAEGKSVFFLGAKPGVAQKAADNLKAKYPGLCVNGVKDGYYSSVTEAVQAINAAGKTDVVFVCLGAPKQEVFMKENLKDINATLLCGLGGSLDVFAGEVKRAPEIFIKLGLEWFYRLISNPSRAGRMVKLPLFLLTVIKVRLVGGNK